MDAKYVRYARHASPGLQPKGRQETASSRPGWAAWNEPQIKEKILLYIIGGTRMKIADKMDEF